MCKFSNYFVRYTHFVRKCLIKDLINGKFFTNNVLNNIINNDGLLPNTGRQTFCDRMKE